ncbi:hypothetical protein [uncultured Kordia sp.]|uniref:hypothetical protein n=1 Tax=uncultured Kordia sp. TaxID=507699 RepID=UPI002621EB68|nr:hypothetical protein [uncultured Kordia sp.]
MDKTQQERKTSIDAVQNFYDQKVEEFHNFMNTGSKYIDKETYETSLKAIEDGTYEETILYWSLKRFKEDRSRAVMGRIIFPKNKLKKDVEADYILEMLNTIKVFDFDYHPQERDLIEIQESYKFRGLEEHPREYIENYMFFKYENDQWNFGYYPLGFMFRKLQSGKLKKI